MLDKIRLGNNDLGNNDLGNNDLGNNDLGNNELDDDMLDNDMLDDDMLDNDSLDYKWFCDMCSKFRKKYFSRTFEAHQLRNDIAVGETAEYLGSCKSEEIERLRDEGFIIENCVQDVAVIYVTRLS
jgi:hypothetical protein